MNRAQKMAWLFVGSGLLGLVASLVLVAIFYPKVGMPKALLGFCMMGLTGLGGFGPLIFKKDKGKIEYDERDQDIHKKAALAGFLSAYLFAGLACMVPFFILGPKANISVAHLPQIFIGAGITNFLMYSVAILVQYGQSNSGE